MASNIEKEREGLSETVLCPEIARKSGRIARMSVRNRVIVRDSEKDQQQAWGTV